MGFLNSKTSTLRPYLQRDVYGNLFYSNFRSNNSSGQVTAIEPGDLLEVRPSGPWLMQLTDSIQPHLATVTAQLFLKVGEDEQAFPFIEQLAETNPRKAKELSDEFLRVWMRNHNPNQNNTKDKRCCNRSRVRPLSLRAVPTTRKRMPLLSLNEPNQREHRFLQRQKRLNSFWKCHVNERTREDVETGSNATENDNLDGVFVQYFLESRFRLLQQIHSPPKRRSTVHLSHASSWLLSSA